MPINEFYGETFVAFTDISGFKQLMRQRNNARHVLSTFYQIGYQTLHTQHLLNDHCHVEGFFISDCAILFVRNNNGELPIMLRQLLQVVEELNKQMIQQNIMLTTSIAYGHFSCEPRIEFYGIEKNIVFGEGYVDAFLDNEVGTPKLTPGLCRVIIENLPKPEINTLLRTNDPYLHRLRQRTERHLYFYWMINNARQINRFEKNYASPSGITNYSHIRKVLKDSSSRNSLR